MTKMNKIICHLVWVIYLSISTGYAGKINGKCPVLQADKTYDNGQKLGNWTLKTSSTSATIPSGFNWSECSVLYSGANLNNIQLI